MQLSREGYNGFGFKITIGMPIDVIIRVILPIVNVDKVIVLDMRAETLLVRYDYLNHVTPTGDLADSLCSNKR